MENTDNYKPSELHRIIQQARAHFPNETIAYNLAGKQTISEYIDELKQRIKEAEKKNTDLST